MIQRWASRRAGTRCVRQEPRLPQWVHRVYDRVCAQYAALRDTFHTRERQVTSRSDRFVAQDKRDARKQRNRARA